ncbi:MAG: carotenoid biosynthesis protein [Egibacteraceae bacterium]
MAPALRARPALWAQWVPVAFGSATVLAQIAYPLVTGAARNRLTVVTVLLFAAASIAHALVWRGPAWTATLVAVTASGGLLVEAVGTRTGIPFGSYAYTDSLGWKVLGVPAVIPLAWTMMAYPALLVGQRIARGPVAGPLVAGAALASWDLFLDPQMVEAGHWIWAPGGGPRLMDIPVSNFAGWLGVGVLMMALLWRALPAHPDVRPDGAIDDSLPCALYLWTYGSSVLAHVAFLELPGSALLGGIGMGAVVAAFVRAWHRRP